MKQFILFSSILLLTLFSNGQELRIVKDNINCTYGVKNSEGNWVIEPNYILIEQYNSGYFLVRDIDGLGIFSPQGTELIPCIYDQISVSSRNWHIRSDYDVYPDNYQIPGVVYFFGRRDANQCIINLKGRKIGSFNKGTEFQLDTDYSIIAYENATRLSSYLDSSGTLLIDKIVGKITPFGGKDYTLLGNYVQVNNYVDGNISVINRKGEQIMDGIIMDKAMIDSEGRICFTKNKCFGVLSASGDVIIPPKYRRNDAVLNLDQKKAWVIFDKENRAGIMKNDGSIFIEAVYDQIYPITGIGRAEIAWMVQKGDRFGIIDLDGNKVIPVKYDQIFPVHRISSDRREMITNYIGRLNEKSYYLTFEDSLLSSKAYDSIAPISDYNHSYSQAITKGFITKRDGKYGILNSDGSQLSACIYESRFQPSANKYFFGTEEDIIEYTVSQSKITSKIWLPFASHKTLHVYSNGVDYLAFIKSKNSDRIIRLDSDLKYFQKYDNLLVAQRSKTREYVFFNSETRKKLPLENITMFRNNRQGQYAISTRSNHHGIIDFDGNVIVDTIYNSISLNQNSSMIWASKIIDNRHVTFLLDSIGRKVLPNQFDGQFEINSGDRIVGQNQRKGVIDSKSLKWKIQPNHFCLLKLFGDYYYAGSDRNKKGILHADGRVIVPIIYDTIILMYANCYLNGNCPTGFQAEMRLLLRRGNTEYLADQNGKIISASSTIRKFKSALFFDEDSLFSEINRHPSYPVLDYSPSLHFLRGLTIQQIRNKRKAMWTNAVLKNEVFDTINKSWNSQRNNCQQGYYWGTIVSGDQSKPTPLEQKAKQGCDCLASNGFYQNRNLLVYQLRSIGRKYITIDISYQNQNNGWDHLRGQAPPAIQNNQHINIIERNGKAEYLSLKDIFPNNDVLMEEFITSLKKRDDLALDCSSLENMLAMIGGNFSLSSQGVHLYLNQTNYTSNSPVQLIIPVENLKNHTESSWVASILEK